MYLYLLKTGYEKDRYDFRISDIIIGKNLRLTRKTVKSTKEKLRSFGLIQYKTKSKSPCHYRLILNYPLVITHGENFHEKKAEMKSIVVKPEGLEIQPESILSIQDTGESLTNNQLPQVLPIIVDNRNIPSVEEFLEYARTLETYTSQLDFNIKEKYETWVNNGWKNNSDRPITNWKSSLKSALPFMKDIGNGNQLSLQLPPNIKHPQLLNKKEQ
ncbi:hypothetical protein [Chryseobacterium pennae]|nr:hypothetical protein [Chryseobacterium pennae]